MTALPMILRCWERQEKTEPLPVECRQEFGAPNLMFDTGATPGAGHRLPMLLIKEDDPDWTRRADREAIP